MRAKMASIVLTEWLQRRSSSYSFQWFIQSYPNTTTMKMIKNIWQAHFCVFWDDFQSDFDLWPWELLMMIKWRYLHSIFHDIFIHLKYMTKIYDFSFMTFTDLDLWPRVMKFIQFSIFKEMKIWCEIYYSMLIRRNFDLDLWPWILTFLLKDLLLTNIIMLVLYS